MGRVPNVTRADAVAAVRNPLAFIAERWTPTPRTVRRAALAALVMAVVIVVTGGAVRLTGSGLGCPTWPKCTDDSLTTTSAMGVHGVIEFGNRMLTYVLCAAVGWAIIAARSQKPYRRGLTRLGWAQFWVVMSNAVLGGIVVLVGLNPYTVAAHFLLSTALIAVATLMWQRTREGDGAPRPLVGKPVRQMVWVLVAATVLLIAVGTVVTGAGPHAGDSSEVERIPLDWENVTKLHAVLAWIVVTLTFALWFVLKAVDAPKGPLRPHPRPVPHPPRPGRHRLRPVLHRPPRGPGRPPHVRLLPGVDRRPAGPAVAARTAGGPGGRAGPRDGIDAHARV